MTVSHLLPTALAHPASDTPISIPTGAPSIHPQDISTPAQLSASLSLTSCTRWAEEHIRSIFEATSDDEASTAVKETFSSCLEATFNGVPLRHVLNRPLGQDAEGGAGETPTQRPSQRDEIERRVNALRATTSREFGGKLKVEWGDFVEVPLALEQSRVSANRASPPSHLILRPKD